MPLLPLLRFITQHPLNRGRPLRALGRFARWQVASRLAPGAIACDWIQGARFLARRGDTGLTGNIYCGLHEFADMAYLLHVLRPGDCFADVGANLGSYTLLAGAVAGARGYAFEPIPQTYARLLDNLRLNALEGRVQAFNRGLGQAAGELRFTSGLDTVNHVLADAEAGAASVAVPVSTLDQALGGEVPQLVKIDVEGYEQPVLAGAARTLADPRLHSLILEVNGSGRRYGFDDAELLATLRRAGFHPYGYEPLSRTLAPLPGAPRGEGNTLFIRDEALVRQRLASAPRFRVLGVPV